MAFTSSFHPFIQPPFQEHNFLSDLLLFNFYANFQSFPPYTLTFYFHIIYNYLDYCCLSFEQSNNHNSLYLPPFMQKPGFKTSPYSNLETGLKPILFLVILYCNYDLYGNEELSSVFHHQQKVK